MPSCTLESRTQNELPEEESLMLDCAYHLSPQIAKTNRGITPPFAPSPLFCGPAHITQTDVWVSWGDTLSSVKRHGGWVSGIWCREEVQMSRVRSSLELTDSHLKPSPWSLGVFSRGGGAVPGVRPVTEFGSSPAFLFWSVLLTPKWGI